MGHHLQRVHLQRNRINRFGRSRSVFQRIDAADVRRQPQRQLQPGLEHHHQRIDELPQPEGRHLLQEHHERRFHSARLTFFVVLSLGLSRYLHLQNPLLALDGSDLFILSIDERKARQEKKSEPGFERGAAG